MRVLYITHYTGLYGANKSLLELIINLKNKYNIVPIVITPGVGEISTELEKLNIENYTFNYYNWIDFVDANKIKYFYRFLRYKIFNWIEIKKIIKMIRGFNIDIVHTNSSVCDVGCKISKELGKKHIWHIREFGKEDYNLIFFLGFKKACEFIEKNSDKIICISQSIKEYYMKGFVDYSNLKVIYNGIKKESYFISNIKRNYNGSFNIIFTGLISPSKNQIELLKAMDILVNERKKHDIKVFILGDGESKYINKLKDFCIEKNLTSNIYFEGKVSNVKKYIESALVGVISSKKEAFGRVTIEYMMGALGVIASNTGANVELIDNNKNGLIYELGNYRELSDKIEELYKNREKLKELSINGQTKAINKFTSDINCGKIYETYKEILNS